LSNYTFKAVQIKAAKHQKVHFRFAQMLNKQIGWSVGRGWSLDTKKDFIISLRLSYDYRYMINVQYRVRIMVLVYVYRRGGPNSRFNYSAEAE